MKKILGLLTLLFIANSAFASIAVSPTRIEINANKIRNNYAVSAIEVRGDMEHAMRFRIYSDYFKITENADMNLNVQKDDPHNISKNIRFVPSEFTVPPGQVQKVRINIANVKALPDGESRAILFLEDVNTKEMNIPNNYGIGAQLIIKTRVGVPVYVDKGKFTKKAEIEYFNVLNEPNGINAELKILSTGNSKIRYSGKIQVIDGKKLVDEVILDEHAVGDSNFYIAKQKLNREKLAGGNEYTVRAVLSYLDEEGNRKNIKKDTILKMGEKI